MNVTSLTPSNLLILIVVLALILLFCFMCCSSRSNDSEMTRIYGSSINTFCDIKPKTDAEIYADDAHILSKLADAYIQHQSHEIAPKVAPSHEIAPKVTPSHVPASSLQQSKHVFSIDDV